MSTQHPHTAPAPAPDGSTGHVEPPRSPPHAPRETAWLWCDRTLQWCRSSWVDIAWVGFVGLNLAAMRLLPAWQTVPFLAIWVSLTAIYGFRLWRLQPTILTLAAVTLATGGVIGVQVASGQEDGEYLAEVPRVDQHRNRAAGGVSLGLAIVQAIAEAHHGSVRAHSTLGQGSVFEVVLPQSMARPAPGRRPAGWSLGPHPSRARGTGNRSESSTVIGKVTLYTSEAQRSDHSRGGAARPVDGPG